MNWEAIAATAEVLGALGVIASLAYLAVQIRQNTLQIRQNIEASQTSSYHQAQEQTWQIAIAMAQDGELTRIVATVAEAGLDALTPEERVRFDVGFSSFCFGIESLFKLYEKGLVDPENWENTVQNNFHWFSNPHILSYLRSRPGPISRRFLAFVEKRLGDQGSAA